MTQPCLKKLWLTAKTIASTMDNLGRSKSKIGREMRVDEDREELKKLLVGIFRTGLRGCQGGKL